MALSKPKFIDKFWPVSTIKTSRSNSYKKILADRIERSKYLIENTFGVKAERVVDTFIKSYTASDKDYPSPIDAVQNPQNTKDFDLYNQYILFLWEYYVKDKGKKKKIEREKPPKEPGGSASADNNPPGSLTLYEGKKEEDLVDEEIDERILKLLGLQDVFDIDYGTYLTLLKEKMMSARMTSTSIPTEEVELLTNEYKRVKGKVGRFKVKSRKLNADNIKATGPIRISKDQFFLAGKVSVPDVKGTEEKPSTETTDFKKDIQIIRSSLENISALLTNQNKILQKNYDTQRLQRENKRRSDREDKLEGVKSTLKNVAQKIVAPFQSILDKIINFITNVLLGRFFIKMMDWLGNPENFAKVKNIFRFLKDWWPALLGAYLLFGNGIGRFAVKITASLIKFGFKLTKKVLPQLLKFLKSPIGMGVGLFTAGATIPMLFPQTVNEQERKTAAQPGTNKEKIESLKQQKQNLNLFEKMQGKGSEIDEQIYSLETGKTKSYTNGGLITRQKPQDFYTQPINVRDIGFSGGGAINTDTGVQVTGAGKDTQLIAAQPGEIVMNKPTVDALGKDFFLNLNSKFGGSRANIPKMYNNVQLAANGGVVGGKVENKKEILPSYGKRKPQSNSTKLSPFTMKESFMNFGNTNIDKGKTNIFNQEYLNKTITPKKLTPMQQWAKNFPQLAKKVKPGQSGYDEIQSVVNPKLDITNTFSPSFMSLFKNVIQNSFGSTINGLNFGDQQTNISLEESKKHNFIPAKQNVYIPPSPSVNRTPNIVSLPPLKKSTGGNLSGQSKSGGRDIPPFSAFQNTASRKINIQIYGIIGVE
jgi:hypothetical protein